jgi:hypothetical protein
MSSPARAAEAGDRVLAHRRFSLREVTLAGRPVGGATIDAWRDAQDQPRWCARLLISTANPPADGWLEGTTQDGRRIGGPVSLGHVEEGPRRGREVLAEMHGDGPLVEAAVAPDVA